MTLVADFIAAGQSQEKWALLLPADRVPFSVADLEHAARQADLDAVAVRWPTPAEADLSGPCVLHVKSTESTAEPDHFIACFGSKGGHVCVADYPNPPVLIPRERLLAVWPGTAIHVDHAGSRRLRDLRWRLWRPTVVRGAGLALVCGAVLFGVLLPLRTRKAVSKAPTPA